MASTAVPVLLDLTVPWYIVTVGDAPTAALAVEELQHHWGLMSGRIPTRLSHIPAARPVRAIVLDVDDLGGDGFTWHAHADRIHVTGHSPRGLLFGVYHLLEAMGCRWLAPGDRWTRVPQQTSVALPAHPINAMPAFTGRCLIVGHYAFAQEMDAWIEWAARNRYNTIFVHTIPGELGLGAVPRWAWRRVRAAAMSQLRARALTLELGGHGLAALLPRKHFKEMPLAFREENGARTKRYNFCPSSPQAKAAVQANARRHFEENPGVDVYHIWADDIPGGGWCNCAQCAGLSSSDQLMLATNMVAEVLADVAPNAEVSFIAYLDTEAPATQVAPRANVCLVWAPRTRNYGRAIDDVACPVNTPYYPAALAAQSARFAGAGTLRVFEYYSDGILFKSVLPVLSTIMQRDLRFYRGAGTHTIQTLMTGTHPWVSVQWTNWLFGRLAWEPDADVQALLTDFCDAAYGAAGAHMVAYYRALEQAFTLVLHQTPDQRGHFVLPASPLDAVKHPVADMEDPVHATPETLRLRAQAMADVVAHIDTAQAHLDAAKECADTGASAAETAHFTLLRAWLHFCAARIRLYAAVANDPSAPDVRRHWDAAEHAQSQVVAWAAAHCAPIYRHNVQAIHFAMWKMRLRRIQADRLTPAGLGWWVEMGTVIQAVMALVPLYWGFRRAKGMRG